MILQFPGLDALHLVLTSNALDPSITLASAIVSFDAEGRPAVEPSVAPSKSELTKIKRLGIVSVKKHPGESREANATWLQILPLTRDPSPPNLSSQAPVLFEIASANELPTIVTEMLRLGNDRQGYRWFSDPASEEPRILLRVVGPPYYTLLRALDREAPTGVRAYVEQAPRVWVEIGHTHPFAAQVRVAESQCVLIRSPRSWIFLDNEPFQDVYDLLHFELPSRPREWEGAENPSRIEVPLRLTAGNAVDVPEFWVLREDSVRQVDSLVRDASDTLISRLTFAIAEDADGRTIAVLRVRPSKQAPPVLTLENALGFKPFFKLTNLLIPVGRRLQPLLRRDAVRRLLADDPDQVVWLQPIAEGASFTPMTLADSSFRALEDWVDYVIEAEQKPLAAWIESSRFEFESFVCREGESKPPPATGGARAPMPREAASSAAEIAPAGLPTEVLSIPTAEASAVPEIAKVPDEWRKKRKELEDEFLAMEGSLDSPARRGLWPKLAIANTGAGDATEAAICWLHAMWTVDEPLPEWTTAWAKSERSGAPAPMTAAEFDAHLTIANPTPGASRMLVAGFLELASMSPVPDWLMRRLPTVQRYLEAQERSLPVRAVWLAAVRLAHLAGSDSLGLARVRDRLVQRLFEVGLSMERDLPGFLRYAGLHDADRLRDVKDKINKLYTTVRQWTNHEPVNLPYVDLFFSFALARIGETTESRNRLETARAAMQVPVPADGQGSIKLAVVKNALFLAFQYRIEQALAGKSHAGSLPDEVLAAMDVFIRKGRGNETTLKSATPDRKATGPMPLTEADYPVGRLRQYSRILEPIERIDAYGFVARKSDPLKDALEHLGEIKDPIQFVSRVRESIKSGVAGRTPEQSRLQLLGSALPYSPRVGEAFVLELLDASLLALKAAEAAGKSAESPEDLKFQGELLERSLQLAGLYDRTEYIPQFIDQFITLLLSKANVENRFLLVNRVIGPALRSLRTYHLTGEVDKLLSRLQTDVLGASSVEDIRRRYSNTKASPTAWTTALQSLTHIAGGLLTFGHTEQASQILDEVRSALIGKNAVSVFPQHYAALARAYIIAVGMAPNETGLQRIFEFFEQMAPSKIPNTLTPSPYFSLLHLEVVETLMWTLVSDSFALGQTGRHWLDDDEFLVRDRIHRDLRRHLESAGHR